MAVAGKSKGASLLILRGEKEWIDILVKQWTFFYGEKWRSNQSIKVENQLRVGQSYLHVK